MDLTISTKNTDFKTLLALVPEVYLQDLESLQTSGNLTLVATVQGDYVDLEQVPAFDLKLQVDDASIQYPDLPKSIDEINIDALVTNPGGSLDATVSAVNQFGFTLGGNPFAASLKVTTPMSNPTYKGAAKGKIDLGSLSDAIPLDSFEMKGLISSDLIIDGDYNMIEKEEYDKIKANGNVSLSDFFFADSDLPQGVLISNALLKFTPRYLELSNFESRIGRSDFQLQGKLENYLAYALKDATLKGSLNHYSKLIDSNEFMTTGTTDTTAVEDTTSLAIIEVPKNLDFVLQSKIDRLLYDKLTIQNTAGKITIRDGRVLLDGLDMNLLNGSMRLNGQYNTQNMKKPFVDFNIQAKSMDINMAANSFSVVDSIVPIAKKAVGTVSSGFKYYSQLGADFAPIMSTVDGGGNLQSKGVEISGSQIQNGIAALMKNDSYRKTRAEDLNINFKLDKGNLIVEPFHAFLFGKKVTVKGVQGLDQSLDYSITMPVTRTELAGLAGLMGLQIPTSGKDVMVDILVKGKVKEPEISLNLDKARDQIGKELEKEAENAVKNLLKDENLKKTLENIFK
jgi:hypothetical protein